MGHNFSLNTLETASTFHTHTQKKKRFVNDLVVALQAQPRTTWMEISNRSMQLWFVPAISRNLKV